MPFSRKNKSPRAPNMSSPYCRQLLLLLFVSLLLKNCNPEMAEPGRDTPGLVDYSFKSFEIKPFKGKFDVKALIPKHVQLYVAAAFSEKDFPSYSKIFNKTLSSIPNNFVVTDSFNRQYKITLSPLFFVLPDSGRFSSSIYEVMCSSFDRKRVAAILVVGESPAAFTVSLAAVTSNIPVLWARGGNIDPPGSLIQQTPLEIRLEPGETQLFEAVRGIFLATHWHSFTLMAAPALAARCASILGSPPLNPKVVPFTRNPHSIFRKLADVSRSTRGVILLLCDVTEAKLVMDAAKRLNMIDGHFVWIWIDTTAKPASFLTVPKSQNLTPKIAKYLDKNKNLKLSESDFHYQSDSPAPSNSSSARARTAKEGTTSKRSTSPESDGPGRKMRRRRRVDGEDGKSAAEMGNGTANVSGPIPENARANNTSRPNKVGGPRNENKTSPPPPKPTFSQPKFPSAKPPIIVGTQFDAQKPFKIVELSKGRGKGDRGRRREVKIERMSMPDYVDDFSVPFDLPGEKDKGHDNDEEEEYPFPANKAWGKIADNFPFRLSDKDEETDKTPKDTDLPIGLLSVKPESVKLDRHLVKGSARLLVLSLHSVLRKSADSLSALDMPTSCWVNPTATNKNISEMYAREIRKAVQDSLSGRLQFQEGDRADRALLANFQILNLVPEKFNINFQNDMNVIDDAVLHWRQVGKVTGRSAHLDTIVWPGGDLVASALSSRTRSVFRIVTALAPPFVMEGALDEDGQCLRGVICHRVLNSDKDNLTLVFNEMDTQERLEDEVEELGRDVKTERPFRFMEHPFMDYYPTKYKYKSSCCYGLAMDLLENIAQELEFEFHLYIIPDGAYGAKNHVWEQGGPRYKWNGIVGDLVSGAAHMSFAALSVSKQRSQVIDFSTPYFFSGVSFLAAPTQKSEIPLLAFLLPFSPELWIAIFTSLNITAMAVACYEWLSPFGLNPWGRQRSRNFSIASALWVMWGLLCGHLVAFKAPKSWPNKFLINVWGGFSVIFVASYTANIAALIAGLFFHNSVSDYHDRSLLTQRVGAPRSSAADYYIHRANQHLWEHMQKYAFNDVETGIALLRNGSLDILIADTPILDYYRATDHGCKLQKIVEAINDDTYAIGMNKGFPLKESISAVISKYSNNGYMDILTEKWYGGLPCFKMTPSVELTDVGQPRPLGVAAVAGVFLLLGLGVVVGVLILILEHLFYRYTLPVLRHQPKGTIWRSRNIMFFSQKLYRFINCVELVSPHHAARELVHTLRQGQITSLFQKSVKKKEHEQRRRRKSKAQFFEMIQEIRRVQQEEKEEPQPQESAGEGTESPKPPLRNFLTSPRSLKHFCSSKSAVSPQISTDSGEVLSSTEGHQRRSSKSPSRLDIRRFSKELFSLPKSPRAKSSTSLDVRRFSSGSDDKRGKSELKISKGDVRLSAKDIRMQTSNAIGRRLSKDGTSWLSSSPPDLNSRRKSHLDITHAKSFSVSENVLDDSKRANEMNSSKFFTIGPSKCSEYNKEFMSKSMTLTPVISKAATLRLASSGSLETQKTMKSRPRLPSPPPSPVLSFRNTKTPKISISDASCENLNVYETIVPQKEESKGRSTHARSKSLDGKHLNFTTTMIDIDSGDNQKNNLKADKQTVSYATLEHKKNNFEIEPAKNVNEKFANIKSTNVAKERQTAPRSPVGKNVPLPIVDVKKPIRSNAKEETKNIFDRKQIQPSKVDTLKGTEFRPDLEVMYAEPQKIRKEKREREEQQQQQQQQQQQKQQQLQQPPQQKQQQLQHQQIQTQRQQQTQPKRSQQQQPQQQRQQQQPQTQQQRQQQQPQTQQQRQQQQPQAQQQRQQQQPQTQQQRQQQQPQAQQQRQQQQQQTPSKKIEAKQTKQEVSAKPKVPPKGNALKQMQARANSAPESGFKQTVMFVPEESLKRRTFGECAYYPERTFYRSDMEHLRDSRCTERCFQTFPTTRTCSCTQPDSHRSRIERDFRFATTGRSSSVPERYFTSPAPKTDEHRKRRTDIPVVVLPHSSRSLDMPSKNPGILKNRRRSKSRDCEGDLPPAPPSPPERNRGRYDRSDTQTNREILLTIKKHSHGYMEPP